MGILAWIVLGLVAGFLASMAMGGGGYGVIGDIIVGVVGALLGGFLFGAFTGQPGITGLNLSSILVAFIGACILILLLRLVSRSRAV